MKTIKKLSIIASFGLLSACGTQNKMLASNINKSYQEGEYCKAGEISIDTKDICLEKNKSIEYNDITLLENLNGGNSFFLDKKYELSNTLYNNADSQIRKYSKDTTSKEAGRVATAALANESFLDYSPMIADDIYLSSYKVLNALALKDKSQARIEINRAYKKQQEASKKFKAKIAKQKKEMEKAGNKNKDIDVSKQTKEFIDNYNKEYSKWNAYKNYMNPYTTYLSGLFFMNNATGSSDYEAAVTYMKRAKGMANKNSFVKQDLKLAIDIANGRKKLSKNGNVWVIFENGMSADFKELDASLPLPIKDKILLANFSVPVPNLRNVAYNHLTVSFKGSNKKIVTEELMNVDKTIISEYNKKFPIILTKAVASTVTKTLAQYYAQQKLGEYAGLASAVYSVATSNTDLRSWNTLPKNVQLAKIKIKKGKKMSIMAGEIKLSEIDIPQKGNSLVYVRIPYVNATPVISVFKL